MFPIIIDTSELTFPWFTIPGHTPFLDGSTSPTVNLPAGTYSFQQYSGYFADFQFRVTESGTVDYDTAFNDFLGGQGTSRLKVGGFAIEVDGTRLSHGLLPMMAGGGSFLMSDAVHRLVLVPASHYGFHPTSGVVASFEFGVDLRGNVVVGSAYSGFAEGAGTRRLTIRGYPIRVDGRMLTNGLYPMIPRLVSDFLPRTAVNTLTLIPAVNYGFQPGSGIVADMSYSVGLDGCLDYPASCDDFLRGRGGDTLTLLGYPVLVDARRADGDLVGLVDTMLRAQEPRFLLGVLLPCQHYRLQTVNGVFNHVFAVERDGTVRTDSAVAGRMVVNTVPRVEIRGWTPI
jgi:hypothetical protein